MALLPPGIPHANDPGDELEDAVGGGEHAAREKARGASRPQSKRSKSDCLIKETGTRGPWELRPIGKAHVALASSVPIWPGQPIRRGPRGQRGRHRFPPAPAGGTCWLQVDVG